VQPETEIELHMMSYSEFQDRLLVALMRAANAKSKADPNSLGIVDAFEVATDAGLPEQEQWSSDAVQTFETKGWVGAVRDLSGGIRLMITGEGREQAERMQLRLDGLS
jgi:hypothetical protein